MPKGMREAITMGEVNGIRLITSAIVELGLFITLKSTMKAMMMGTMAIVVSWLASWALSSAEPMAAKMPQ